MKYDIKKYKPCVDAMKWYNEQPDSKTAWENCHRGDWMLWIAKKLGVDDRVLTLAKGYCAKTVIHLMKDERSRKAVEIAIMYGEGKATKEQLDAAAAYAAAYAYVNAAARKKNQLETANICRKYLTDAVFSIIEKEGF